MTGAARHMRHFALTALAALPLLAGCASVIPDTGGRVGPPGPPPG